LARRSASTSRSIDVPFSKGGKRSAGRQEALPALCAGASTNAPTRESRDESEREREGSTRSHFATTARRPTPSARRLSSAQHDCDGSKRMPQGSTSCASGSRVAPPRQLLAWVRNAHRETRWPSGGSSGGGVGSGGTHSRLGVGPTPSPHTPMVFVRFWNRTSFLFEPTHFCQHESLFCETRNRLPPVPLELGTPNCMP
jgi:hypothetical protein